MPDSYDASIFIFLHKIQKWTGKKIDNFFCDLLMMIKRFFFPIHHTAGDRSDKSNQTKPNQKQINEQQYAKHTEYWLEKKEVWIANLHAHTHTIYTIHNNCACCWRLSNITNIYKKGSQFTHTHTSQNAEHHSKDYHHFVFFF